MKARRRFKQWLALGLALAALSTTAAQAATRPDDRAGPLGVGTAALQNSTIRPDDRAGTLGVGTDVVSRYLVSHPAAVRPDDRAGPLGVGTQSVAADTSDVVSRYLRNHSTGIRPDDRAGTLGVGTQQVAADTSDVVSRYLVNHPAAVRPDDRGGIRGVGTGTAGIVTPAPDQSGSIWGAAELAAASALGALAVALAGFALIRHRRSAAAALQS
jgi:hypothetical protein